MIITAILAGAGVYFVAKDSLSKANFGDRINLIRNDDDGSWCKLAKGQVVDGSNGGRFCAIGMEKVEGKKLETE